MLVNVLVESACRSGGACRDLLPAVSLAAHVHVDGLRILSSGIHGIHVGAGEGTITDCQIQGAQGIGLRIRAGATLRVSGCEIAGSRLAGIVVEGGDLQVTRSNIHGNGGPGLDNVTPDTVDARDNWWGDPAGPGGDGVAGNVVNEPWRSEPVPLNAQAIQNDARARSQSSRIASMSASMVAKRWMSRSRAWKSMRTSSP
jgi:hypothetical protein